MATTDDYRTQVQDLQRLDPANQSCIECGSPNPQWASVSYGVFVCLECSGTHRSLGVHLSFVRSISMDKWSKDQFAKMQLGGNANFAQFVQQHPDELGRPGLSLKDKYASYPAALYRAQLAAKVDGKPFDPSSVQWSPPAPPSAPATASASPALGMTSSGSAGFLNGPMVGFGSGSSSPAPGQQPQPFAGLPTKDQNQDYFARMGQANASRPEHLPPSQGGRYTGFGSSPAPSSSSSPAPGANPFASPFTSLHPSDLVNDPMAALSKGWSLFSTVATAAASTVGTVVTKGSQLVQDPQFQSTVQSQVARGATTVGELLTKVGETAMATGTRAYTLLEQQRAAAAGAGGSGSFGAGSGGSGAFSTSSGPGVDPAGNNGMWGGASGGGSNAFGATPVASGATSDFFSQPVGGAFGPGGDTATPFRTASPPPPPPAYQETLIGGEAASPFAAGGAVAPASGTSAMQRKGTAGAKKSDDWDEW